MYIETSSPRKEGDTARLVSPLHLLLGKSDELNCVLEFWYHMYGEDIAKLNVYSRSAVLNNTETLLWSLTGNQLDTWHPARISFIWSQPFDFEVLFKLNNSQTYRSFV